MAWRQVTIAEFIDFVVAKRTLGAITQEIGSRDEGFTECTFRDGTHAKIENLKSSPDLWGVQIWESDA